MALVDIKQLHCPKCDATNHIHIYKHINVQVYIISCVVVFYRREVNL